MKKVLLVVIWNKTEKGPIKNEGFKMACQILFARRFLFQLYLHNLRMLQLNQQLSNNRNMAFHFRFSVNLPRLSLLFSSSIYYFNNN